jgi:hypothetical protein
VGLRETRGISAEGARNQWFCEEARAQGRTSHQRVYARGMCAWANRTLGVCTVRTSPEEFEDSQVWQAGLMRKLHSLALKEAECSGSYNLSILNTLTGGTAQYDYVQGHTVG